MIKVNSIESLFTTDYFVLYKKYFLPFEELCGVVKIFMNLFNGTNALSAVFGQ